MTGGRGRSVPPRQLARDPENWPEATIPDHAQARVVQAIAQALTRQMTREGLGLRAVAAHSGVNRQAVANLLAGSSWPDVATLSRLEDALGVGLYPGVPGPGSRHC
ncbi:helix-turn-helix domain-containing protein [Streptomyces sp. A3M-1-3]|uniref:helix-turn-helix domain-containing protein n=1 Tax=Streptomyces sp. A3M-1-3 TaxID=2962044 RepID=UPI0020B7DD2F|nr:helix-turn-helix transcriptional regulator [Streptomyces sp. A3M-1-3]MCP3820389.1 helix-turn-helix domain-containing protein [Streptomyces sp. A3M-1-3]